ncbi:oligosaccharide flippase family protein [Halosimplex sp. J119]
MSVVRKVFSDSAFTAVRSIVSLARGLVVVPLITNLLGVDSYGIWVTIFSAVGLVSSTAGLHLHGSLIRFTDSEVTEHQTYSDVIFMSTVIGFLVAALLLGLGQVVDLAQLIGEGLPSQATLIVLVAFLVPMRILFRININFPRAIGHVKVYDSARLFRDFLETIVLVAVFMLGRGIIWAIGALLALLVVINVSLTLFIAYRFSLPSPDPSNFRRYLSYGVPMIPKQFSTKLLKHTDKYLLLYFLGSSTVGVYAIAQAISKPLVKFISIFNPTLYPTISKEWDAGNLQTVSDVYENIFRYYTIFGIPAMVGIVVLSDPIISLLSTSSAAQDASHLVPIFLIGYFIHGYDNSIRYVLTSAKRTEVLGATVILAVGSNIILNLSLIPRIGMNGAAIATVLSYLFMFSVVMYYSKSEVPITFPKATILRSISSAVIMGAVLSNLNAGLSDILKIATYPLLGVVIYFSILLLTGEFSGEEVRKIKGVVQSNKFRQLYK